MGLLVNGLRQDKWYDTDKTAATSCAGESAFRNWITSDGSSAYPAAAGRYHLCVGMACDNAGQDGQAGTLYREDCLRCALYVGGGWCMVHHRVP